MTHDLYILSENGLQIWNGPIEHCPWWFSYILQLENRKKSLNETAGFDPEKLPPPRELYALNRADELDIWFEERDELRERKAKEPKVLDG